MSQLSRPLAAHPARLLALLGALLLAALIALPAPALAHDTLLSTDPEDGASLETSPEEVTFTFSADILDVSPLVRITDESGEEVAEIVPSIEGPTATAALEEPLPAGTYDLQWRVVSSDGHPIEGTLTLTVEQDPAGEEATADEEGTAEEDSTQEGAADEEGGDESAAQSPQEEQPTAADGQGSQEVTDAEPTQAADAEGSGGLSMPLLLGILAVIVVAVVIAGIVIMRRRD